MIDGCQDKQTLIKVERELRKYPWFWPTPTDCQRAFTDFRNSHLSRNLGFIDALIGNTAVGLNLRLATFNLKHYPLIPNLVTLQP